MSWNNSWDNAVRRWNRALAIMFPIILILFGICLAIAIS